MLEPLALHYISLLLISGNYATLLLVLVIAAYNDCSLSARSLGCHGDLLAGYNLTIDEIPSKWW